MSTFSGSCQCGAVRYECAVEAVFTGNCHCRDCQKATGGAYVPVLAVPADALKITGDVKYYDSRADSGHTFSAASVPIAAGACSASPRECRRSSRSRPAVWTIRVASNRAWIFSQPVRSLGIT